MSKSGSFQVRYHVKFGSRRTTITLDRILSELIALSLDATPDQTGYHRAVQQWLQVTLPDKLGDDPDCVSQYTRKYAVEHIAKPELMARYWDRRIGDG